MDTNKEMGNNAIDPYEHQLLEMFKSCDTQESGYLDCTGLEKLCIKLHLDEAKDQLIECLLLGKATVTFPEFRDALLTLLDSGLRQNEDSREPSPEREVSPKFVFGQKKYGRRSRPESTDQDNGGQDDRLEESDFDTFLPTKEDVTGNLVQDNQQKLQRDADLIFINKDEMELQSRGQPQVDVELRAAWERLGVGSDGYLDQDELALVCRAVGMERAADEIVNEVFSKLDCDRDGRISFNEFLQLFRSGGPAMPSSPQHNSAIPSSSSPTQFHPHHLTSLDINSSGYVSTDSIVELWEQSGVPGAANLLQELGFSGTHEVSFSLLNSILDEELRNLKADIAKLPVSPLVTYLSAALSLSHVQIKQLRNSLEQMTGERDKLRNDLAEANHRATLLAQEVDDRHARMERSTQVQVKLLEQRHAEQVKQLGLQLVSEREQLTSTTLRLEKKLADVQEDEVKLRSELAALQSECANMEKENRNLIEQLADYELAQKQAEEQQQKMEALQLRLSDLESNSEQVASFVEQLTELKEENTNLRDRNDELTIQIESLSTRLSNRKQGSCTSLEGGGGGGTKRRGHSPPGVILDSGSWGSMSPSPRQGKVRRCCTENDLSLDNVRMEGLAICQPLRHSESGLGAELDTLDDSLTLSNYSDTTISFKVGSDASKDADVEKLQAHIIELERLVEQYRLKLAVHELGHEAFDEESEEMINSETETPLLNKRPIAEDVEKSSTKSLTDKETNCEMSEFNQKESSVVEMEIQTSIEDPTKVDKLERHCQELQSKLSEVQTKILEMISEKKSCNEENCNLKEKIKILTSNFRGKSPVNFNDGILWESSHNVQLINEKDNEFKLKNISTPSGNSSNMEINETVKSEDSDKVTNNLNNQSACKSPNKFLGFKQTDFNNTKDGITNENNHKFNFNSLSQFAFEITNNLNDSDLNQRNVTVLESKPLSPLCLKSEDHKSDVNGAINNNFNTTDETLNNNCESVEEQLSSLISENKVLRDKCNDLESCLEMMRIEYEKCEDYWQNKLDDERRIFDQEQKLSDSKFIELEHKIREYAEMFSTDCEKACDGRLPTIEEKDSLERQFIDLEEEFEEFRKKSEVEGLTREREIMELKEAMANSQTHFPGCDVAVQTANFEIEADSEKQADMKYHWQPENKQVQIENTAGGQVSQCCCSCHQELTEELRKVQQLRSRVQSECKLLTRKRDLLLRNISNLQPRYLPTACEREIMQNLATRLHHQELRCRHLQSALKYQQRQMEKAVQVTWEQHQNDLVNLRGTLNMTQEKLQQQMRLTKELMERLTKADILVKDLYVENGQLVAACHSLEQRYSGEKNTVSNLA